MARLGLNIFLITLFILGTNGFLIACRGEGCEEKCLVNCTGTCELTFFAQYSPCSYGCIVDELYNYYSEPDFESCGKNKVCYQGQCLFLVNSDRCQQWYGEQYLGLEDIDDTCKYNCVSREKRWDRTYAEEKPPGTTCLRGYPGKIGVCKAGACLTKENPDEKSKLQSASNSGSSAVSIKKNAYQEHIPFPELVARAHGINIYSVNEPVSRPIRNLPPIPVQHIPQFYPYGFMFDASKEQASALSSGSFNLDDSGYLIQENRGQSEKQMMLFSELADDSINVPEYTTAPRTMSFNANGQDNNSFKTLSRPRTLPIIPSASEMGRKHEFTSGMQNRAPIDQLSTKEEELLPKNPSFLGMDSNPGFSIGIQDGIPINTPYSNAKELLPKIPSVSKTDSKPAFTIGNRDRAAAEKELSLKEAPNHLTIGKSASINNPTIQVPVTEYERAFPLLLDASSALTNSEHETSKKTVNDDIFNTSYEEDAIIPVDQIPKFESEPFAIDNAEYSTSRSMKTGKFSRPIHREDDVAPVTQNTKLFRNPFDLSSKEYEHQLPRSTEMYSVSDNLFNDGYKEYGVDNSKLLQSRTDTPISPKNYEYSTSSSVESENFRTFYYENIPTVSQTKETFPSLSYDSVPLKNYEYVSSKSPEMDDISDTLYGDDIVAPIAEGRSSSHRGTEESKSLKKYEYPISTSTEKSEYSDNGDFFVPTRTNSKIADSSDTAVSLENYEYSTSNSTKMRDSFHKLDHIAQDIKKENLMAIQSDMPSVSLNYEYSTFIPTETEEFSVEMPDEDNKSPVTEKKKMQHMPSIASIIYDFLTSTSMESDKYDFSYKDPETEIRDKKLLLNPPEFYESTTNVESSTLETRKLEQSSEVLYDSIIPGTKEDTLPDKKTNSEFSTVETTNINIYDSTDEEKSTVETVTIETSSATSKILEVKSEVNPISSQKTFNEDEIVAETGNQKKHSKTLTIPESTDVENIEFDFPQPRIHDETSLETNTSPTVEEHYNKTLSVNTFSVPKDIKLITSRSDSSEDQRNVEGSDSMTADILDDTKSSDIKTENNNSNDSQPIKVISYSVDSSMTPKELIDATSKHKSPQEDLFSSTVLTNDTEKGISEDVRISKESSLDKNEPITTSDVSLHTETTEGRIEFIHTTKLPTKKSLEDLPEEKMNKSMTFTEDQISQTNQGLEIMSYTTESQDSFMTTSSPEVKYSSQNDTLIEVEDGETADTSKVTESHSEKELGLKPSKIKSTSMKDTVQEEVERLSNHESMDTVVVELVTESGEPSNGQTEVTSENTSAT